MRRQAKAIVAGIVAGLGFAVPAASGGLDLPESLGIALAALIGYQATYWTGPKGGRVDPADPS